MYAHTHSQKQTHTQKSTLSHLFWLVFISVFQARGSTSRAGLNSPDGQIKLNGAREQVCGLASVTGSLNLCESGCVRMSVCVCFTSVIPWTHTNRKPQLTLFFCLYYNEPRKRKTDPTAVIHSSEAINEVLRISRHTLEFFPFRLADIIALRVWGDCTWAAKRIWCDPRSRSWPSYTHTHCEFPPPSSSFCCVLVLLMHCCQVHSSQSPAIVV